MTKKVKLFNENFNLELTGIPELKFLDFIEEGVEMKANTTDINGKDGVLLGPSAFGPFNLTLNLSFKGQDTKDLRLIKQKLRGLLFRREPYYIWHSDLPGKKYAVYCAEHSEENLTNSFATFAVTFTVYKGFSESVNTTSKDFSFQSNWMFENGIPLDFNPVYYHESNQFTIWNGSTDTIDPRNIYHQLKIKLNINAEDGFELVNYTTGDIFKYHKSITEKETFVLNGIHAYKDNNKVGIDTNRGLITLAPGKNIIKVKGDVKSQKVLFEFPFIYR